MGCDIHAFAEYKRKDSDYWKNFGGEFRLDRDYGIFAKLANVRNYEEVEHFEPRGLPKGKLGYETANKAYMFITSLCKECGNGEEDHYVDEEQAKKWVADGYSEQIDEYHITHPDWHSHSWLTTDEFEKALNEWQAIAQYRVCADYWALLKAMRELERLEQEVRLVFWFDN